MFQRCVLRELYLKMLSNISKRFILGTTSIKKNGKTDDIGLALFGQPLSPNREGGWGFLTEKQVKNRFSNHLGIIVFVTDRQVGTFSERNM